MSITSNRKIPASQKRQITSRKRVFHEFTHSLRLVFDTHKSSFLSGLIPVLDPGKGADAGRVLPVYLALISGVFSVLLQADQPFVVTVPAVERLVLGGESFVTGGRANILD